MALHFLWLITPEMQLEKNTFADDTTVFVNSIDSNIF